ncbi:MAG: low molecular weight protein-tyrosine-phosphatase [Kiloniellaceae bacterium]
MRTARVLFVCTGNICRSPTAEAVLRKMAADAGLAGRIECDSAGTHAWHAGLAPDPRAVRAGAERGYELVSLRARRLSEDDFRAFDLIIAMDRGHDSHLEARRPADGAAAGVRLLLDFAPEAAAAHAGDVPDPYHGGPADFEHALDLIEAGVRGLLAALRRDYL